MAIEIVGIAHESGGRVGDGLALSPPAFPRSSTLSGYGSPRCGSSPFCVSALLQLSFSEEIDIVFHPSGSRVAEETRALRSFSVHYIESFHIRPCLLVWLFGCI